MKRKLMVSLVTAIAAFAPFSQTIYMSFLSEMTDIFRTSPYMVNLSISVFMLMMALMQIVYGPLSDKHGRRRIALFGVAVYTLATVGCHFANSIELLLLFRALQAAGIAAGPVAALAVISDLYKPNARSGVMSAYLIFFTIGPMIGPAVGGFVGTRYDFATIFLFLLIVAVPLWLLLYAFLAETVGGSYAEPLTLKGFVTVWKNKFGLGIIALGFIQNYALYNYMVFLPDILGEMYELSAEWKGMALVPLFAGMIAGIIAGNKLFLRSERGVIIAAALINSAAVLSFLALYPLALPLLIFSTVLYGALMGMSLPGQTTLLTIVYDSDRGVAIGVYNFFRYIGMGTGPLLGILLFQAGGYAAAYGFLAALFLLTAFWLKKA